MTGAWKLNVERARRYRLTLRQWPIEADKPVDAVRSRVEIAGQRRESSVEAGTRGVVCELNLPAGRTDLGTWLYDEAGRAGGAYFTEVELLDDDQ